MTSKHNVVFLKKKHLCAPLLCVLFLFLSPSLFTSHDVLVVIYLDMREGTPQGNAWQGFLCMIPGIFLHSSAVIAGDYKAVIKDCCHVTVTNGQWQGRYGIKTSSTNANCELQVLCVGAVRPWVIWLRWRETEFSCDAVVPALTACGVNSLHSSLAQSFLAFL